MRAITIRENSATNFDHEVNAYLDDGWSIHTFSTSPNGHYVWLFCLMTKEN